MDQKRNADHRNTTRLTPTKRSNSPDPDHVSRKKQKPNTMPPASTCSSTVGLLSESNEGKGHHSSGYEVGSTSLKHPPKAVKPHSQSNFDSLSQKRTEFNSVKPSGAKHTKTGVNGGKTNTVGLRKSESMVTPRQSPAPSPTDEHGVARIAVDSTSTRHTTSPHNTVAGLAYRCRQTDDKSLAWRMLLVEESLECLFRTRTGLLLGDPRNHRQLTQLTQEMRNNTDQTQILTFMLELLEKFYHSISFIEARYR